MSGCTRRQAKKGTKKSFTYATLAVLGPTGRFTAGLLVTRPFMRLTTILAELLAQAKEAGLSVSYVLLDKEFYAEALEFLQHSVDLYGAEPGTLYNMAVCCHGLRQTAKAVEHVERALELDAEFDAARALRIKLQTSAAR